jgi:poly(beta-D-mannuronate) lyase
LLLCLLGPLHSEARAASLDQASIQRPRASFIDVPSRMALLQSGVRDAHLRASLPPAHNCQGAEPVLPVAGPMTIAPRYLAGNTGAVHPDYEKSVALYRRFEDTAAQWANAYLASGDAAFAHCLVDHLHRWAQAGALMDYQVADAPGASNQAWYQAEWSIAASALALSQVLGEPSLDAARVDAVIAWLHKASRKQISHPGGRATCCNNHAYWRGLHATMVGVLANDTALYRWGLGRYALAIEHLAADGHWPLEMARKEQSVHYQNFALLPLVLTAEIAAQQGLDLYAHRSPSGQDLHTAVRFLAGMVADPQRAAARGLPAQDRRAFVPGRGDQAWGEFYRARFGGDPLGLLSAPSFNARTGGNATMLAYKAPGAQKPTTAIDLLPWKLQLPDRRATDVESAQLMRGFRSPYFEIEPGGSLLFTAPVGGGLTATAKYTRSELREMLDPADKARNWPLSGRHAMSLRQEVVQPPQSGRVVVFQIHAIRPDGGAAPPLVKAQWRDNKMQFLVKAQASGGKDIAYEVPDVPLGKAYDAGLAVQDGRLTMRINGTTLVDDFAQRDPNWQSLRFYFKAGNYPQDKDVGDGRNLSVVRIHSLNVTHE